VNRAKEHRWGGSGGNINDNERPFEREKKREKQTGGENREGFEGRQGERTYTSVFQTSNRKHIIRRSKGIREEGIKKGEKGKKTKEERRARRGI